MGCKTKERLVYTTPDGEEFELHNPPTRTVLSQQGWGMPDSSFGSTQSPFQHGETATSIRLSARTVQVNIRHKEYDRDGYWRVRSRLLDKMRFRTDVNDPVPGTLKRVYYENGVKVERALDGYWVGGLVYTPPARNVWDHFAIEEQLTFDAKNPVVYDPNLVTVTITDFTGALVLPFAPPFVLGSHTATYFLNYAGTWYENPVIEVDGPASEFGIINWTTGARLGLNYSISLGETVTFDLRPDVKTIKNNYGDNLIGYVSEISDFLLVQNPQAEDGINTLFIALSSFSSGDTEVRLKYYNRYYGI